MGYAEIIQEFSRLRDVAKSIDPDTVKYGRYLSSLISHLEHMVELLSTIKLEDIKDKEIKQITFGPVYLVGDNKYLRESAFGQDLLGVVNKLDELYKDHKENR
ncbi:MAG: hypothetical protein JXB38_12970 [Anaerolineales bacterium]|nr:hypothetical protein [Anaerolineales bacterium]